MLTPPPVVARACACLRACVRACVFVCVCALACRACQLELLAISRLEKKIIDELASVADWTTSEPWSEQAQFLRDRLQKLFSNIRLHLATQESLLPEILRDHWGFVSPPNLMIKQLAAAKKGLSKAAGGSDRPKLLMWILHYLEKRAPMRAKNVVAQLPMAKRVEQLLLIIIRVVESESQTGGGLGDARLTQREANKWVRKHAVLKSH